MRAIVIQEHGGVDALKPMTVPDPTPGSGEVRVKIKACGINHLDLWVRRGVPGHKFPLPMIPGNDISGVVDQLGAHVLGVKEGDAVVISPGVSCGYCARCLEGNDHYCRDYGILGEHRDGGCAEYVVVPAANAVPKPEKLSFEEAAAFGVAWLTAWEMVVNRGGVRSGETVLIQAAGSGVSSAAIQLAKLYGAIVITTSSTEEKLARARELGADHTINYRTDDLVSHVKHITGKKGVDLVIDHVGGGTTEASIRVLAWQGRLVICGATTESEIKINLRQLFFKSLTILGSTMGSKRDFIRILSEAERGRIRPVIDRRLPLDQVREAHRILEAREAFGKVVLLP